MKYSPSPREIPWALPSGFPSGSGNISPSQYRYFIVSNIAVNLVSYLDPGPIWARRSSSLLTASIPAARSFSRRHTAVDTAERDLQMLKSPRFSFSFSLIIHLPLKAVTGSVVQENIEYFPGIRLLVASLLSSLHTFLVV